jgi:hypothetical protein
VGVHPVETTTTNSAPIDLIIVIPSAPALGASRSDCRSQQRACLAVAVDQGIQVGAGRGRMVSSTPAEQFN